MLPPVETDERFLQGVESFNRGDFFDAHEIFEELYFEAVRDEIDFVRIVLQASVGVHHVERGQTRSAIQRLAEAGKAIEKTTNDRGFDLAKLRDELQLLIDFVGAPRGSSGTPWPRITRR